MSTLIKIRRGNKSDMPALSVGELAFAVDTRELYTGTQEGNVLLTRDLYAFVAEYEAFKDQALPILEELTALREDLSDEDFQTMVNDAQNIYIQTDKALADSADALATSTDVEQRFNLVIQASGANVPEVMDARMGEQTLRAYNQKVAGLLAEKALKTEVRKNTDSQPINYLEMDTETKAKFTGGSVAVVGPYSTGKENIKERAVSLSKMENVIKSSNLFDKTDVVEGFINTTTGILSANSSYWSTGYRLVKPNFKYIFTKGYYIAFYDEFKNFISGVFGGALNYIVTVPANAVYIRYSIHKTEMNLDTYIFAEGETLPNYEAFYEYLPDKVIESMPKVLNELTYKADYPKAYNKALDVTFTESPTKWALQLANAVSAINGVKTFIPTAKLGNSYQTFETAINRVYYVAVVVNSLSANIQAQLAYSATGAVIGSKAYTGAGTDQLISFVGKQTTAGQTRIKIISYDDANFTNVSFSKPVLVDLTELYGAGSEPSIADFEALLRESNQNEVFFPTQTPIKKFVKTTDPKSIRPIYVKRIGNVIDVRNKYNATQDVQVTWKKNGSNDLPNFGNLRFVDNQTDVVSKNPPTAFNFAPTTDFFAPYKVKAVANINGDTPTADHFTGGNHAYDGNVGGTATARNIEFRLFVEGREVVGDYEGYAEYIEIVWKNRVQAMNTKKADGTGREVLEETFRMFFDGERYNIDASIEMLEDLNWTTYYGLQAYHSGVWDDLVFFHSSPNRKRNAASVSADSLNKTCNQVTLVKGNNLLDIGITSHGIGNREFLSNATRGAFNIGASKKAYFWLVDGATFTVGDVLTYKGHYRFYSK